MSTPTTLLLLLTFLISKLDIVNGSLENINYYNACLKCILNGDNFSMIVPGAKPGKCCTGMISSTDYCDPAYTWTTYSYTGNAKYFYCPITTTCTNSISVSDKSWNKDTFNLLDGDVCIHRIKYDTLHLGTNLQSLYNVAGDTQLKYTDITNYITQNVLVRLTSSSAYISVYYKAIYLQQPPAAVLPSMTLNTLYTLTPLTPYISIVIVSSGGPSNYLLEYGRVDERSFSFARSLKEAWFISGVALVISMLFL